MIDLDLTPYNLIALSTSGGTINHILFLYWNHQISRKQTLEYLADIPSDILAEWIDDLVNRVTRRCRSPLSRIVWIIRMGARFRPERFTSGFLRQRNASVSKAPSKTGRPA